nr:RecName: Full=Collagen alpha-2(I) chain homolog; AltName: Full=Peptide 4 [Crocodylus siamensis]
RNGLPGPIGPAG